MQTVKQENNSRKFVSFVVAKFANIELEKFAQFADKKNFADKKITKLADNVWLFRNSIVTLSA